ncbi:hypothetical protein YC2023_072207 [Brassica napus]
MNWSRSWSKVCDSDRIVPSPSRSAPGPWCWVGRSVMFLFDCWLAGWPFISNPWCGSGGSSRPNPNPKQKSGGRFRELDSGMDWTDGRKQDFVGEGLHQYLGRRRSRKDFRNLDKIVSWAMRVLWKSKRKRMTQ